MKVFLGGTCNDSTWRDELISMFDDGVLYFNPVVENWTEECKEREIFERNNSELVLYVITPKMTGVYSIAEVIDDSNKRPDKTIFLVLDKDGDSEFSEGQKKSLNSVKNMALANGAVVCDSLLDTSKFINSLLPLFKNNKS